MLGEVGRLSNDAVAVNGSECCISRYERFIWNILQANMQPVFEVVHCTISEIPQMLGQLVELDIVGKTVSWSMSDKH